MSFFQGFVLENEAESSARRTYIVNIVTLLVWPLSPTP